MKKVGKVTFAHRDKKREHANKEAYVNKGFCECRRLLVVAAAAATAPRPAQPALVLVRGLALRLLETEGECQSERQKSMPEIYHRHTAQD